MRLAIIAAVLLSFCASAASAQTIDPALEKAQQARSAARIAGDEQTWGRYTTDDFVVISTDGQIRTKAQRMTAIKGTKVTTPQSRSSDLRQRVYGDTVVRTTRNDSQDGAQLITTVWVKQGGAWKTAHVQFTAVPRE